MISMIKLIDITVLPLQEALELGFARKPPCKIGIDSSGEIRKLETYHKIRGVDAFFNKEANKREGGWEDLEGTLIESYCLHDPIPDPSVDYIDVSGMQLVDLLDFSERCSLEFKIVKSIRTKQLSAENLQNILEKIEEKTKNLESFIQSINAPSFNKKCNIHIGGGLIATFNEVMLEEDGCIDNLQGLLNKGWRIIKVCIQPDQRRPDYILGRYNS